MFEYFVQLQERHKRNGCKRPAHQKYRKTTISTDVHSFGEIHLLIYAEFAESRYLFLELRFTDRKINKTEFWNAKSDIRYRTSRYVIDYLFQN